MASTGLGAVKNIANAGYWEFKIVRGLAKNVDLPRPFGLVTKLGSIGSRLVAGAIKAGADAIPENVIEINVSLLVYEYVYK